MLGVIIGLTAMVWKVSAEREVRTRFPEKGRFFPSRWFVFHRNCLRERPCYSRRIRWSKQIIEHERAVEQQEKLERERALEQQQKP
jgi:hypothetical protein